MTILYRSFRVFGKFRVGRRAHGHDARPAQGNMLEIFHADFEDGAPLRSFARIRHLEVDAPLPSPPAFTDLPQLENNIFIDEARDRIEAALGSEPDVLFWVSKPTGDLSGSGGRRLFLFDAFCLDQFNDSATEIPSDRFPLVPVFVENGRDRTSRISFGSGGGSFALRMELGFTMPVPIGTRGDQRDKPGGVLCLGGLFQTTHLDASELTVANPTLFGPTGDTKVIPIPSRFGAYGVGETPPGGSSILPINEPRGAPQMQSLLAALGFGGQSDAIGSDHVIEFKSAFIDPKDNPRHHYAVSCRRRVLLDRGTHVDISGGTARLDLNGQLGGMIEVDQKSVLVECHWGTDISDDTVRASLHDSTPVLGADIHASLRWTSTAKLSDGILGRAEVAPPRDEEDRLILRAGGLEEAARMSMLARAALSASQRQPQSILPTLSDPVRLRFRPVPLIGYARGLSSSLVLGGKPTLARPDAVAARVARFGITLDTDVLVKGNGKPSDRLRNLHLLHLPVSDGWPRAKIWTHPPAIPVPLAMRMVLDGFDDKAPDPRLAVDHNHIRLGHDIRIQGTGSVNDGIFFAIGNDDEAPQTPHEGGHHFMGLQARLGSLAFSRAGPLLVPDRIEDPSDHSTLTIRRRDRRALNLRRAAADLPSLDVEWMLTLAIDTAQPVTTDIPHGDRDERSNDLLIRETPLDNVAKSVDEWAFALTVKERLRDDQDRSLQAELHENTSASLDGTATFTVLSQAPFSAYRFSRRPLSTNADPTKPVATYHSDAREWLLLKASETYQYTRPAGAIGEDADKPGMLELHDPLDRTAPIRPALAPENGVERRHVLDMRLSPPSTIWVDPSDLTRDFLLPEYAGRELFRQGGDFGLGMKLTALRSELLYGLSLGLMVPQNSDGTPGPRIAELQTLTGRMVGLDSDDANGTLRQRWSDLRQAFEQRPERLEVWTLDVARENPFVPARFDEGLSFALRNTALLAPPVKSGDYDPGNSEPATVDPPRFHPHGLSGGALWPLESANVNRVVAGNPVGTGGTLDGVVLSPLGDSGNQTVQFLGGYVTIITETRDGHLHKQRVEILGRIAGLWHRAKHVVVYGRTTAPSPQFTPDPNQPTRTRRPVLRKVEEFVEILQPSRRYPDVPDIGLRSRGFLEEVRFNSKIIHVNSAWGGDVGTLGWEVPLWNRGEAELRPQIYPYPDVAFLTVGEGNSAAPQAIQECLDVANLYFYTDPVAAQTTPDTDAWPVRHGVDTSSLGAPNVVRQIMNNAAGDATDGRRTAASRILPGLRRFTWRVAPSATRTRINNERGTKPIFAGLESVSLMRDPGGPIKEEAGVIAALAARPKFEQFSGNLPDGLSLPLGRDNPSSKLTAYQGVVVAVEAIDTAGTPNAAQLQDLANALDALAQADTAKTLNKVLDKDGTGLVGKAKTLLGTADKLVTRARDFDAKECEAIATKAAATIRQRKLLALQMARQAESETLAHLRALKVVSREEAKEILYGVVVEATRDLFDQAAQGLGDVRGGVATARAVVADWRTDAIAALTRARSRVTALRNGYDDTKPWSRSRIDQALARVKAEFDAAEKEAVAALDEARLRLATEIDASANGVGARVSQTIAQVLRNEQKLLTRYGSITDAVIEGADKVRTQIDKLPTQAKLNDVISNLKTKADGLSAGTIKTKALATVATLESAVVAANIDTRKTQAQNAVKDTIKFTDKALKDISKATQKASADATAALQDVQGLITAAQTAANEFVDVETEELKALADELHGEISSAAEEIAQSLKVELRQWKDETDALDKAVNEAEAWVDANTRLADRAADKALGAINQWLAFFDDRLKNAENVLNNQLRQQFRAQVIGPAVDAVFETTNWPEPEEVAAVKAHAIFVVQTLTDRLEIKLDSFTELPTAQIEEAKQVCISLMGYKAKLFENINELATQAEAELKAVVDEFKTKLADVIAGNAPWADHAEDILKGTNKLLDTTNEIGNQLAEAGENARAYLDRGAEIIARAGDAKPAELPGMALQLISAATQAPEIAAFRTNADRIRLLMDDAKDVLETPAISGVLDQLGDALKALGLDFKFKEFGDNFNLDASKNDLLRRLVPDLGGIKLSDMLPRAKIPGGLKNAVKVTHDLDTKAGRAWVQADVNVPLPGRETLFTIGPFTLFLKNSRLTAFVRAEASKDQKEVGLSDQALLLTNIEAVVAGQIMVTLEDVAISYSTRDQLDFNIDPKKIRINQTMRFIQDTLGSIFGDELGGLKFIKESGIPVGVEHQFAIPPISLMYGTSGVTNLQISNRFSLRAYPDFIIANRFNLSRRELPFLFSVFIIGGTGYIQVDTEYRPFDKQLMVVVEAGAGGSAALGFAFGPVAGSVFISLSVVLRYQKQLGSGPKTDDGLSVSVVLVIAGNVSLWGMVSIYLGLMLSMNYHESGRIDGLGQLTVELRISRWFKLRFSTQVKYQLRNGRSTTEVTSETSTSGKYKDALKKFEALEKARKSL